MKNNNFFTENLILSKSRIAETKKSYHIFLDKNEQSIDVPEELKMEVLNDLFSKQWNRYPEANLSILESKIANYCGANPQQVMAAPGSASIITAMINYFAINKKNIHIALPSYSLFEYHCNTYNIPYTPWFLNQNLEFDYDNIPHLSAGDILIITSPNNPTGNTIDQLQLEKLLQTFPESLIVLDGVYTEFAHKDLTHLIHQYENFIMLRSFSKAFPIAGLRLGYLCANEKVVATFRKLMLPFSITPFTMSFAMTMLFDNEFTAHAAQQVENMIAERERITNVLNAKHYSALCKVYPSQGNFVLLRIFDKEIFHKTLNTLDNQGIKVLNTSNTHLLCNTMRISIGTFLENEQVLSAILNEFETNLCVKASELALN